MSSFWKWFLIVIGVLVVVGLCLLVPAMFMLGHREFGMMRPFGGMPMMHSFGFLRFGGFLLRLLVPAVVIGLLVALGIAIGKSTKSTNAIVTKQVDAPQTQPEAESQQKCSNCSKQVQSEWSHCPYCGSSL